MHKKIAVIAAVFIVFLFAILIRDVYKNRNRDMQLNGVTSSIAAELYNPAGNVAAGNPNGNITMVEFFDYNCDYCRKYFPMEKKFIESHPELRVVYKEFMLFGKLSKASTYGALSANLQGKYLPMLDAMLSAKGLVKKPEVIQIAQSLGLNVSELLQDMKSPKIHQQIQNNRDLANTLHIDSAPTVLFIKTQNALSPELSGEMKPYILTGGFTMEKFNRLYEEAAEDE